MTSMTFTYYVCLTKIKDAPCVTKHQLFQILLSMWTPPWMQCSLVAHNMVNKVITTHGQCAETTTTANASIPINRHRPQIAEQAGGGGTGSFPQRRRAARPGITEATLTPELKDSVVWWSCQRPTSSGWNKLSLAPPPTSLVKWMTSRPAHGPISVELWRC